MGWLREAKVSCHQCIQVRLTYNVARPASLSTGKGIGGMLFLLFLHFHLFSSFSPVPLFHLALLFLLFSLSLGDDTKWPTRVDVSLNTNTIKKNLTEYLSPAVVETSSRTTPSIKNSAQGNSAQLQTITRPKSPQL